MNESNPQHVGVLAIWLSERDRLIGRLESLLSMADKYVPDESPNLKDAIAAALAEVENMYGSED